MKKSRFVFAAVLFLFSGVHVLAQEAKNEAVQDNASVKFYQRINPSEVFVGDTVELTSSFDSAVDLFAWAKAGTIQEEKFETDSFPDAFGEIEKNLTLKSLRIHRSDMKYEVSITFIPWECGLVKFPSFDVITFLEGQENREHGSFIIDFEDVKISSLLEKYSESELKSPVEPLLVPSTTAIVWVLACTGFVLFVLILAFFIHFRKIVKKFKVLKKRIGFHLNAKVNCRNLNRLLKNEGLDDKEFAYSWGQIMRGYLEYRFHSHFHSVPGSKIAVQICKITGSMISTEQENAVVEMTSLFVKMDYIRFASCDGTSAGKMGLSMDERKSIIKATLDSIRKLENNEIIEEGSK